jgi:hypothetical protein
MSNNIVVESRHRAEVRREHVAVSGLKLLDEIVYGLLDDCWSFSSLHCFCRQNGNANHVNQ